MKFIKKLTAAMAAAVIAVSMGVSASAATWQDCVQAAKDCGVQAHNVQQLSNFLEAKHSYFTSAQFDEMIADIKAVSEKFVVPVAKRLFNKTPGELTEAEKIKVGREWSEQDKLDIQNDLINLGKRYDVTVTITKAAKDHYDVAATITDKDGKTDTTVVDKPVSDTGDAASPAGAVVAGFGVLLAASGIVVVSKKNKQF